MGNEKTNYKAKIALNKSLVKEFSSSVMDEKPRRIVYLNNGDEFQIRLFNPKTTTIGARIRINGESIPGMIVIRPGESIWLDRYIDKKVKFKFSTYEVDDGDEVVYKAITNNGMVEVKFYNKKSRNNCMLGDIFVTDEISKKHCFDTYENRTNTSPEWYNNTTCMNGVLSVNDSTSCSCNDIKTMYNTSRLNDNKFETGQVCEGSKSNQEFNDVDDDFDTFPFDTETIYIYPVSRKPYNNNDLHKFYCSECGRKIKDKYKYCPYCGAKIN